MLDFAGLIRAGETVGWAEASQWWNTRDTLADLATDILYSGGPFIHAMPYPGGFYNDEGLPLMYAIRAAGVDL